MSMKDGVVFLTNKMCDYRDELRNLLEVTKSLHPASGKHAHRNDCVCCAAIVAAEEALGGDGRHQLDAALTTGCRGWTK